MSAPAWTQDDVRACADGLRDYIREDGIPDNYPPKLRRACQRCEWARAVFLEHSHMCRYTAHVFGKLADAGKVTRGRAALAEGIRRAKPMAANGLGPEDMVNDLEWPR